MNRRFIIASLTLSAAVAVIALAIVELQGRGTEGITGFTVADRQASKRRPDSAASRVSTRIVACGSLA